MRANRLAVALLAALLAVGWPVWSQAADPPGEAHAAEHDGDDHGGDDHGDDGAHGGGANPLTFDPDLAIFSAIVFILLLIVLRKFAWGPIMQGLEQREASIADNVRAAEEANQEAQKVLGEYETKLAAAQDQVRAILDEARRDAEHTQQEIVAKAKQEAEAEMARAKREVEIASQGALKDLSEHLANQAVSLASKLVAKELKPEDHAALIDQAVAQFPQMEPSKN